MSDRATRDWEHYSENVEAILTDLIAELRDMAVYLDADLETQYAIWARKYAERAEALLREVTGDE